MKNKMLISFVRFSVLSVVMISSYSPVLAASNFQSKSNSKFENTALIKSGQGYSLFDGSKSKTENEKDTEIFYDDFSSGDLSRWTSSSDVTVKMEGSRSFASFPVDASLDLTGLKETNYSGFYRVSYDQKYNGFQSWDDLLLVEWQNPSVLLTFAAAPLNPEQNQWNHVEILLALTDYTNTESDLRLLAPTSSETSNQNAVVDVTNFSVSKVVPTLDEDFSDGEIDPRIQTNFDFNYEIIENNELKVTMPSDKLPLGEVGSLTHKPVLTAVEQLEPMILTSEKNKVEELFFFTSIKFSSEDPNTFKFSTSIKQELESGDSTGVNYINNSRFLIPDRFNDITPSGLGLSNVEQVPNTVNYGVYENKLFSDTRGEEIMYVKNFKSYKGLFDLSVIDNQKIMVK